MGALFPIGTHRAAGRGVGPESFKNDGESVTVFQSFSEILDGLVGVGFLRDGNLDVVAQPSIVCK